MKLKQDEPPGTMAKPATQEAQDLMTASWVADMMGIVAELELRAEDPKDINPRNFDNSSNLNWQGVFLFIVYTSVVLGFFLFSRTGKYGSGDGPAPIPPLKSSFQSLHN
jgi:hypothetical protein